MISLGIAQSHGSAACLMKDGRIIGMIQEERLTRRKNQVAFPKLAIAELAGNWLGGSLDRVDRVVFAENLIDPYGIALDRYSEFSVADHVREQRNLWYPHFYGAGVDQGEYWRSEYQAGRFRNFDHNHDLSFISDHNWEAGSRYFSEVERPAALSRHFGWHGPTRSVDHHTCHAYYAVYGAGLTQRQREDALVLTADGWGEGRNWSAWVIQPGGLLQPVASGADHVVGRLYKFATLILGMKPNEHEYKVMGLAPYAKHRYAEAVERILLEALDFRDGCFVRDRPLKDSYYDLRDRLEGHRFDAIAAGLQSWASRVTCEWAKHWLKHTGKRGLCFSGGLSMNIRINGDLLDLPEVDFLSVPASGGDESLAAGACFYDRLAGPMGEPTEAAIRPITDVYLGGDAKLDGWDARLLGTGRCKQDFVLREGVGCDRLAALLAADVVVARCVDRAEFGARSLGNRAILANPANAKNVARINTAIKSRDFWMPFCPSVLAEYAPDIFFNPKSIASPYMTIGYNVRPEWHEPLRASLHGADMSARPQFVSRDHNPEYWALIDAFRHRTGIPGLLNTSLNVHGEPMNYSVADAVRTVAISGLECLALPHGKLLYKKEAASQIEAILARD